MGLGISKPTPTINPLVVDEFDGESGDHPLTADQFTHEFGPEWVFTSDDLDRIKTELTDLKQAPNKLKIFSLKGQFIVAKPYSVYDGDTCNFVFKFENQFVRYRFRMIGYNSPEIRSDDPKEREQAIKARDYLANRLNGKRVLLYLGDFDKYGRPLCDCYILENDLTCHNIFKNHINREMIEKGLAVPYNPREIAMTD